MRVKQLFNHNGNAWANQFVIQFEKWNITIFQSYNSLVALVDRDEKHITLGDDWDYSRTTLKAVGKYLKDYASITADTAGLRKALKSGTITDLWGNTWTVANGCNSYFEDFLTEGGR